MNKRQRKKREKMEARRWVRACELLPPWRPWGATEDEEAIFAGHSRSLFTEPLTVEQMREAMKRTWEQEFGPLPASD